MSRSPSPSSRHHPNRDTTPGKRLFVIGHRSLTENEYRIAFEQYGKVVDLWMLKNGAEPKGIVYITFSKISEAALAIEELNGKQIGDDRKYVKVLVASDKKDGSVHEFNEEERFHRLFVMLKKGDSEDTLRETFGAFGKVAHVMILRMNQNQKRELGFVKFESRYSAALALEGCDPEYRAVFATPRGARDTDRKRDSFNDERERGFYSGVKRSRYDSREAAYSYPYRERSMPYEQPRQATQPAATFYNYNHMYQQPLPSRMPTDQSDYSLVHVTVAAHLSEANLRRLFDVVPGLLSLKYNTNTGIAFMRYSAAEYANYAVDKLDGFEYPPGHCLIVRLSDKLIDGNDSDGDQLHRAAEILQMAGINPSTVLATKQQQISNKATNTEKVPYCEVEVPLRQCTKPVSTPVAKRLFIVCQPSAIPDTYLKDVFCRFGDLIDIHMIRDRNFGYVKFANEVSANTARDWLHLKNVAGCRLKVIDAEDKGNQAPAKAPDDMPWE